MVISKWRYSLSRLQTQVKQVWLVSAYNFRGWHKNPRIIITFALAFILCFLLSDKTVRFANEMDSIMQIAEAFIWTFGDADSILLSSLLLLLLFADMPFINRGTPFYLLRLSGNQRRTWLFGQGLYVALATCIYMVFILLSTGVVCMQKSFVGNMWSETAAILGYSGVGQEIALPALVKTLESTLPYQAMFSIFTLMLLYTLLMAFIMLFFSIAKGAKGQLAGVVAALAFSLYGFLLSPELIKTLFTLDTAQMYKANVAMGWISPLNHATYHMHNFGFDRLPCLWHSYCIFAGLTVVLFVLTLIAVRRYNFDFKGGG